MIFSPRWAALSWDDCVVGRGHLGGDADTKRVSQRTADGFRQFVYQGPDMLKLQLERDESEETVAHYTMGSGLEAMRREASSFYHYNHLGTTLALTGADEAVSDTYRHDAWGGRLGAVGDTGNPFTFAGRHGYYRMPRIEAYHAGMRELLPQVGRFNRRDPLFGILTRHAYPYARNRPTSRVDPRGLLDRHCQALRDNMNDAAIDVSQCPSAESCKSLNDRLYRFLHECHGFYRPEPPDSGFPPPKPPRIGDFAHIPAYSLWRQYCHAVDLPPLEGPYTRCMRQAAQRFEDRRNWCSDRATQVGAEVIIACLLGCAVTGAGYGACLVVCLEGLLGAVTVATALCILKAVSQWWWDWVLCEEYYGEYGSGPPKSDPWIF